MTMAPWMALVLWAAVALVPHGARGQGPNAAQSVLSFNFDYGQRSILLYPVTMYRNTSLTRYDSLNAFYEGHEPRFRNGHKFFQANSQLDRQFYTSTGFEDRDAMTVVPLRPNRGPPGFALIFGAPCHNLPAPVGTVSSPFHPNLQAWGAAPQFWTGIDPQTGLRNIVPVTPNATNNAHCDLDGYDVKFEAKFRVGCAGDGTARSCSSNLKMNDPTNFTSSANARILRHNLDGAPYIQRANPYCTSPPAMFRADKMYCFCPDIYQEYETDRCSMENVRFGSLGLSIYCDRGSEFDGVMAWRVRSWSIAALQNRFYANLQSPPPSATIFYNNPFLWRYLTNHIILFRYPPGENFCLDLEFNYVADENYASLGDRFAGIPLVNFWSEIDPSNSDPERRLKLYQLLTRQMGQKVQVCKTRPEDACMRHSTCSACGADVNCGWCADQGYCTPTDPRDPNFSFLQIGGQPSCTGYNRFPSCGCESATVDNCGSCTSIPGCAYCLETGGCVPANPYVLPLEPALNSIANGSTVCRNLLDDCGALSIPFFLEEYRPNCGSHNWGVHPLSGLTQAGGDQSYEDGPCSFQNNLFGNFELVENFDGAGTAAFGLTTPVGVDRTESAVANAWFLASDDRLVVGTIASTQAPIDVPAGWLLSAVGIILNPLVYPQAANPAYAETGLLHEFDLQSEGSVYFPFTFGSVPVNYKIRAPLANSDGSVMGLVSRWVANDVGGQQGVLDQGTFFGYAFEWGSFGSHVCNRRSETVNPHDNEAFVMRNKVRNRMRRIKACRPTGTGKFCDWEELVSDKGVGYTTWGPPRVVEMAVYDAYSWSNGYAPGTVQIEVRIDGKLWQNVFDTSPGFSRLGFPGLWTINGTISGANSMIVQSTAAPVGYGDNTGVRKQAPIVQNALTYLVMTGIPIATATSSNALRYFQVIFLQVDLAPLVPGEIYLPCNETMWQVSVNCYCNPTGGEYTTNISPYDTGVDAPRLQMMQRIVMPAPNPGASPIGQYASVKIIRNSKTTEDFERNAIDAYYEVHSGVGWTSELRLENSTNGAGNLVDIEMDMSVAYYHVVFSDIWTEVDVSIVLEASQNRSVFAVLVDEDALPTVSKSSSFLERAAVRNGEATVKITAPSVFPAVYYIGVFGKASETSRDTNPIETLNFADVGRLGTIRLSAAGPRSLNLDLNICGGCNGGETSGGTLRITGQNLGDSEGRLFLGGTPLAISSWANDEIIAQFPPGAGAGLTLYLETYVGHVDASLVFDYLPPAVAGVTSVSSFITDGGYTLTVTGDNFGPDCNNVGSCAATSRIVDFGGFPCVVSRVELSSTSLECTMGPGSGDTLLLNLIIGGQATGDIEYFSYESPAVTSVLPNPANVTGTVLTVLGANFGPDGTSTVAVNGIDCPVLTGLVANPHVEIRCTLAPSTGVKPVVVTTSGQQSPTTGSSQVNFASPVVYRVEPGARGTAGNYWVTLTGLNFGPSMGGDNGIEVDLTCSAGQDPQPCEPGTLSYVGALEVLHVSDTEVRFFARAGRGQQFGVVVRDTVEGGVSATLPDAFSYASPTIVSIDPVDGDTAGGVELLRLTLIGTNFGPIGFSPPGVSIKVMENGVCANPEVTIADVRILCDYPALTSALGFITNQVQVNVYEQRFNYTWEYRAPSVGSVLPGVGPPAAGSRTTVNIAGDYFGAGLTTGVTLRRGGETVDCEVAVGGDWNHQLIVCDVVPQEFPRGGGVDWCVTVVTSFPGHTKQSAGGASCEYYDFDTPTVATVTPRTGTWRTERIVITGTNFGDASSPQWPAAPMVGPFVCDNFVSWTDTQITCDLVPVGEGTDYRVSVNVSGVVAQSSVAETFSVADPELSVVTPVNPASTDSFAAQPITITGTNFGRAVAPGTTYAVRFYRLVSNTFVFMTSASPTAHTDVADIQEIQASIPVRTGSCIGVTFEITTASGVQESLVPNPSACGTSPSTFSYNPPVVSSISGCTPDGLTTKGCATEGGTNITIAGSNFGNVPGDVTVWIKDPSNVCNPVSVVYDEIVCTTPAIADGGLDITIQVNAFDQSDDFLMSYEAPEIDAGSLSDCVGVQGPNLVLTSVNGGTDVCFTGVGFGTVEGDVTVLYGADPLGASAPVFDCVPVLVTDATIRCTVSEGLGLNLVFIVKRNKGGFDLTSLVGSISLSYPLPVFQGSSIRGDSIDQAPFIKYVSFDPSGHEIYIDVVNLPHDPALFSEILVTASSLSTVECTTVTVYATQASPPYNYTTANLETKVLRCNMPASTESNFVFSLRDKRPAPTGTFWVGGPSADTYDSASDPPLVTFVSGCSGSLLSTADCPTNGGVVLSLSGNNFCGNATCDVAIVSALVGGRDCPLQFLNETMLTCDLPAGVGVFNPIVILSEGALFDNDTYFVGYAPPSIDSVSGCDDSDGQRHTVDCEVRDPASQPSVILTLTGSNFGDSGATVLVGGRLCANLVHDGTTPHELLECELPFDPVRKAPLDIQIGQRGTTTLFTADVGVTVSFASCGAGTSFVAGTGCVACVAGTVSSTVDAECVACASGRYSNSSAATACDECPAGSYSERNFGTSFGPTSCIPCAAGRFAAGSGASTCSACAAGTFAGANALACEPCGEGTANPQEAQSSCALCGDGFFSSSVGNVACTPCAPGSFRGPSSPTTSECELCPVGQYQESGGASACFNCPVGSATGLASEGSATCDSCVPGRFSNASLSTKCETCPAGSVTDVAGATSCSLCAAGTFMPDRGLSLCVACPAGRAQNLVGATSCDACNAGFYAPSEGLPICQACPLGEESVQALGSVSCVACTPGRFRILSGQCVSCLPGQAQPSAQAIGCNSCNGGFYSSAFGSASCLQCPAGRFSPPGGVRSTCGECAPGSWSTIGSDSCQLADTGAFAPSPGLGDQYACPLGTAASSTNSTLCIPCSPGQESNVDRSACVDCAAGSATAATGSPRCIECGPGTVAATDGLSVCASCPPGFVQLSAGQSVCDPCPLGTYTGLPRQLACLDCVAGRFAAALNSTACLACAPGSFQAQRGKDACLQCAPGRAVSSAGRTRCTDCLAGRFSEFGGVTCDACSNGTFSGVGATTCTDCSAGFFSASEGEPSCTPCPVGRFASSGGSAGCELCALGRFQASEGRAACESCAAGFFASNLGSLGCIPCPPGTVAQNSSSGSCTKCPLGRFQTNPGSLFCEDCTVGRYTPLDGQSRCVACPAGRYNTGNASLVCDPCVAGRYQPGEGRSSCFACVIGSAAPASASVACTVCPFGRYGNASAASSCVSCAPGRFQGQTNATGCIDCPPGRANAGIDARECQLCTNALVAPNAGQLTCDTCPAGKRSDPTNTLCTCQAGLYLNDSSAPANESVCLPCLEGGVCAVAGLRFSDITTAPGWWRQDSNSSVFYQCLVPRHCLGGASSTCGQNRKGPICAVCVKDSALTGTGDCSECKVGKAANTVLTAMIVGAVLLGLLFMFVLLYMSDRDVATMAERDDIVAYDKKRTDPNALDRSLGQVESGTADKGVFAEKKIASGGGIDSEDIRAKRTSLTSKMKIFISFFQVVTTLQSTLDVDWPGNFRQFIGIFNVFNLDFLQWASVNCIRPVDYYERLVLVSVIPIAIIAIIFLYYMVPALLMAISDKKGMFVARKMRRRKAWKFSLFVLFLSYPYVCSSIFQIYVCREVAGVDYLVADFEIECFDDKYNRLVGYNVAMIALYPVGIPLLWFLLLCRNRKRLREPGRRFELGFLYDGYDSVSWWWDLLDMAHKVVLTSLLNFLPNDLQLSAGMCVAVAYAVLILLRSPYYRKGDDRLHLFAQAEIFLVLLGGYNLQQNDEFDETADLAMSVILVILISLFITFFLLQIQNILRKMWKDFRGYRTEMKDMRKKMAESVKTGESLASIERKASLSVIKLAEANSTAATSTDGGTGGT